jgi:hypothetical protein
MDFKTFLRTLIPHFVVLLQLICPGTHQMDTKFQPTIKSAVAVTYYLARGDSFLTFMYIFKILMQSRIKLQYLPLTSGRATGQVVSCWPLTAEAQVSPCRTCGGQNSTEIGFSPTYLVFPCEYYSTMAPFSNIT